MKEDKIKQDIEELVNYDVFDSQSRLMKQPVYIKMCTRWKSDGPICNKMGYACKFLFGCFQCRVDGEGFCECSDFLSLNLDRSTRTIIKIPTCCLYKRQNECESNNPHRIGSNISNSICSSNGEPDSQSSNRADQSRLNVTFSTEQDSTNQNAFAETGLCVPTTNGSNSLIPSDLEPLNTTLEGSRLQNDSIHDNKSMSIDMEYLETHIKEVSDLTIAQISTSL